MLNIVIFGPPGSGKGTQGKLISEKYGLYTISIGEILRQEIENKTELGVTSENYINQGELLPDLLVFKIVTEILRKVSNNQGYIFDGFPRTIVQAKMLDSFLKKQNTAINVVFSLYVEKEELIKRLLKRSYLLNRSDDNLKTIQNRLSVYKKQSKILQKYYKKKEKLIKIIGKGSIENIFEYIVKNIDYLFSLLNK